MRFLTLIVFGFLVIGLTFFALAAAKNATNASAAATSQAQTGAALTVALADLQTTIAAATQAGGAAALPNAFTHALHPTASPGVATTTTTMTATLTGGAGGTTALQGAATTTDALTQRITQNANTASIGGAAVVRDATYRLHVVVSRGARTIGQADALVEMTIAATSPPVVIVSRVSPDSGQRDNASLNYADTQCGSATLNCAVVTVGADTTVINAQLPCVDTNANTNPTTASKCQPVGVPTSSPRPANTYTTTSTYDGSNGN